MYNCVWKILLFDKLNLFFVSDWNEIEKISNFALFSFGEVFNRINVFDEFSLTKVLVEITILNEGKRN